MSTPRSQPQGLPARTWIAVVALLSLAGMVIALIVSPPPAQAESSTTGNPWVFNMDDDSAEGVVINCPEGELITQCLVAYDYLNQPISGINSAGAALFFAGDDMLGFGSNDIINYRFQVDPENAAPPQNDCYGLSGIEGRVFIGAGQGPDSGVYVCKNGPYALYWSKLS